MVQVKAAYCWLFSVLLIYFVPTAWHLLKLWCYYWCLSKVAQTKQNTERGFPFWSQVDDRVCIWGFYCLKKKFEKPQLFKLRHLICLITVGCQLCLFFHKCQKNWSSVLENSSVCEVQGVILWNVCSNSLHCLNRKVGIRCIKSSWHLALGYFSWKTLFSE